MLDKSVNSWAEEMDQKFNPCLVSMSTGGLIPRAHINAAGSDYPLVIPLLRQQRQGSIEQVGYGD